MIPVALILLVCVPLMGSPALGCGSMREWSSGEYHCTPWEFYPCDCVQPKWGFFDLPPFGSTPVVVDNIMTAKIGVQLQLINGPRPPRPLSLGYQGGLFPTVDPYLPTISTLPKVTLIRKLTEYNPACYIEPYKVPSVHCGDIFMLPRITIKEPPLPSTALDTAPFDLSFRSKALRTLHDRQQKWLDESFTSNAATRPNE
jgi:hypothetical protein